MIKNNSIIQKYSNQTNNEEDGVFVFMNDGYVEVDEYGYPINEFPFKLNQKNCNWKYQANLYYKSLSLANVTLSSSKNKTYLDLSCGRGGGIDFVKENYNFNKIIGVDVTPFNINYCKSWINNIDFFVADATNLTALSSESVDVITTVEACTYYTPFEKYVSECYRVLRPGGILIQTSPYFVNIHPFTYIGFKFLALKDITYNVSISCSISKFKLKKINEDLFSILKQDEKRYEDGSSFYNILVFKK